MALIIYLACVLISYIVLGTFIVVHDKKIKLLEKEIKELREKL